jgi:membrane protein
MLYALVPMVKVPLRVIALGSLAPAALFELAKVGYAFYTKRVVTYSAFYGSFAAIPLFLLWVYIAWYITLLGAVWVRTLQLRERA